ncbi:FAD-binding protein [Paraburkholderia xenovorans]|uniref:electron transfer flavoprotein subunit alpha/FixB family protein n=1 Tax=Paraburkholderia xenovorans TaxID=36873 RepID=UPI0038BA3AA1
MTILVIGEHDNTSIKPATLSTIAAAQQIGAEIDLLIAGSNVQEIAVSASSIAGIRRILVADAVHLADGLAENLEATVMQLAHHYRHVFAPATAFGKNVAPRIAARLDVAQISEVTAVEAHDTFQRPIYAGSVLASVQSMDAQIVVTVRATAFDPVAATGGHAEIEQIAVPPERGVSRFVGRQVTELDRPELTAARIVVSGGRGLGSGENYQTVLAPLADKLGAALGASRAAVDAGFVSNDYQVGQTGKIVAPELYLAIGISGAIQHLAGMKDSKVIVAINKDAEAPIFGVADYGLVGDLFTVVPELTQAV